MFHLFISFSFVYSFTFLYEEVYYSSIHLDSWLLGRSPARGNISYAFGDEDMNGRGERIANEVNILNIFTWMGVIGVLMFSIVFIQATNLAVNYSNNIYCKFLGVYVAYKWMYGWVEEFSRFALFIGARYAIPFASNHCFLHSETFHFNQTAVLAEDILPKYKQLANEINLKSECVVMVPGSSWSDNDGFQIVSFDYLKKDEYLQGLLLRHSDKLEKQYKKESQTLADFESFHKYFEGFIKAIPWLARKFLKLRFVFHISDAQGKHNWMVDTSNGTIRALVEYSHDFVVIETPALVLNDCCKLRLFSTWTPSKRLKIHLPSPEHLKLVNTLFLLLDFYELEMLPLRKNLSLRSLSIRLRRWREIVEVLNLFLKHRLLKRPFIIANLFALPERIKTK